MNTENWRIRNFSEGEDEEADFFIEADLPKPYCDNHYPRVEVMQEDFGDHNGYTKEMRLEDAKLIVLAPKMKDAINEVLKVLEGNGIPNNEWIKNRLLEALS
jgi:hypothetical protein